MIEDFKTKLEKIYLEIPEHTCKQCGECCGPIFWSYAEDVVIREYLKEHNIPYRKVTSLDCPYLLPDKKCEIYPARPAICRLQGVTEGMACPNNTNQKLKKTQGFDILSEVGGWLKNERE